MDRLSDRCLEQTLELAEQMLRLADEGDALRQDPGCGVLYGMLRDSAYKLKQMAEAERRAHLRKTMKRLPKAGNRSLRSATERQD